MADTDAAANVLGTTDIPPNLAAVQPSGDAANIPATVAAPAAGTDTPTPMGTTPGTEVPAATADPEIAAASAHHNWLGKILDEVGTILGGDKTIVATKHPDGSVSVEHNPSTTGEKWGRIAQAALGGAARGMAVGQGPGGAGKAFAAGGLAGLQQPQQALDAANKEAANMNAEQLAIANTALTHQKLVQTMLASREAGLSLGAKEAEILQGISDAAGAGPNTVKVGTFTDMAGIMQALKSNPAAMAGLTNQALKVFPTSDTEGHVQLEAYLVDKGADARKNDKTEQMPYTDVDPTTHEPILKSRDIAPQSQPLVQIRQGQQAATAQFIDMHNKWRTAESTADKKDADPVPKSAQEALAMAATEKDPARKQALTDLVPGMQKLELAQKAAGRASAAGGGAPSLGGASGPDALAALPAGDAATVKAIGEGRQAPPSRYTPAGKRIMDMVNQVYPDYDGTQFPTYQKMRTFMSSGVGGVGLNFIGTARNHLDELERTIPNNVTVPLIGSAINWAKNTATRATSPELRAFESARTAVSDEVAKAYKGGALSQEEHDQMLSLINESDSPGALRGSIGEFRRLLNGKLSSYQTQWTSAMPRGAVSPNSALEGLLGATPTPAPGGGGGAPAATSAAAAPTAAPRSIPGVTPLTPPANEPVHPGRIYGNGPKGVGWYK
jgi:hypothetical protein